MTDHIERPPYEWAHTKKDMYRNILGSYYILSVIPPFKGLCEKKVNKLILDNPEDKELIEQVRRELGE